MRIPGQTPLGLVWGENLRNGKARVEWHWECGCACHPRGEPGPHIHPCDYHFQKAMKSNIKAKLESGMKQIIKDTLIYAKDSGDFDKLVEAEKRKRGKQ